ncbi:MAG: Mur ligase family protein [candidate division WOR-3 bacterium]
MNHKEAIDYLYSLVNYEREMPKGEYDFKGYMEFLSKINNPQYDLNFPISIVGTKGKGTTAFLLTSIFLSLNKRVGLYTSPHIFDVKERIRIGFEKIREEELAEGIEFIKSKENVKRLTFFEALTTIAFKYFKDKDNEINIFEAGLGGRLDCTNALDQKITLITKIDYDHEKTLGNDIKKIAWEKASIIKEKNIVISLPQRKKVKKIIEEECIKKKADLYFIGKDIPFEMDDKEIFLKFNSKNYRIKRILKGDFNVYNIILASSCAVLMGFENFYFKDFKISGRFDILNENPLIITDCAHNSLSLYTFLNNLKIYYPEKRFLIIFGTNKDKNLKRILWVLKRFDYDYAITKSRNPRAIHPEFLEKEFNKFGINVYDKNEESFKIFEKYFFKKDVCVTGSFYLIEEVYKFLNKEPS